MYDSNMHGERIKLYLTI